MDFKDYYETLGVTPDADEKAIRQAFRQLARQVHPDVNPGNKEAEEKFKMINEAYQVLSDAEQRKKYDELRAQYLNGSRPAVANRILTGKTGPPNLAKGRASNTPTPKTWRTSSEVEARIPTSSPISLARRAAEVVAVVLHPAHVADGMSNTKSI